jgi:hypothetical protein
MTGRLPFFWLYAYPLNKEDIWTLQPEIKIKIKMTKSLDIVDLVFFDINI